MQRLCLLQRGFVAWARHLSGKRDGYCLAAFGLFSNKKIVAIFKLNMSNHIPLLKNYYAVEVDTATFFKEFRKQREKMFNNTVDFSTYKMYSEAEIAKLNILRVESKEAYRLSYFIMHNNELGGWATGCQADSDEFYMHNTGIFEQHRRKGLYTKMLQLILATVKEKGYQKVISKHATTNNAVIIPKLKAGFLINGMEVNEKFGVLVKLIYYFNKDVEAIARFRSGEQAITKNNAQHGRIFDESDTSTILNFGK